MSGPSNFFREKIGTPAPRCAAAPPSLTGTAPQLPPNLVIDNFKEDIMAIATIARIAQLEVTARSISRRIDRTEYFMDMIDWMSMTTEDCYLISMQIEYLAETLADTEMELDFRYEQLCMTAQ